MPESARFGPYRLQGEIGHGAMGIVYRAFDERHSRIVALKVLSPDVSSDREYRHRFEQESHIVAALTDPHVIPIHSYGEIDGHLYLDMRLVEGRSVKQWLRESGPMSAAQAVSIVSQVADALDSAHADGVIHRDVKPSNVLIARHVASRYTRDEFAYLVDFGIARSLGGTDLTSVGFTVGTIDYMAPERFDGQQSGIAADVYSLGCLLVECLTGRKPFPGAEVGQVVRGHLHSPPPRPSQLIPGVPAGLDAVVARALAKDPRQRYVSAGELADDARAALSGGGHGAFATAAPIPPAPPTSGPADYDQPTARSAPAAFHGLGSGGVGSGGLGSGGLGSGGAGSGGPGSAPVGAGFPQYASGPAGSGPRPSGQFGTGSHQFPVRPRRDPRVLITAICAAIVIAVALVVAVIVHNNRTSASCAAGVESTTRSAVVACATPTSPPGGQHQPTSQHPASSTSTLTAAQAHARDAIGSTAKCTPAATSLAPSDQTTFLDAAVTCTHSIPGITALYAFHIKSRADATATANTLSGYSYDSVLDQATGKVVAGQWSVDYHPAPQLELVWPTWQVEVVAVGATGATTNTALLTHLRTVSWQYGRFGLAPDYGSQATLRSYTALSCSAHRLEEISPAEFQVNVAWLVCTPPKGLATFTSIQLFRVDTAAHARDDLTTEKGLGFTELKSLKGTGGATGECVLDRGTYATVTSIFCQYPAISGYDQVHLESQLTTTMSVSTTKKFFAKHSLDMPTMFDRT